MYIFLAKYIKAYNSKPGTIQNKVVTILTDAGQTCGLYTHQLLGMRVTGGKFVCACATICAVKEKETWGE
jgi:hypothetical protein